MAAKTDKKFEKSVWGIVAFLCVVMLLFNIGSIGRIIFADGEKYRADAQQTQLKDTQVSALRGTIYDSNMNVLANSSYSWNVYMSPYIIKTDETRLKIAENVSRILSLDFEEFYAKVCDTEDRYEVVKKRITATEKTQLSEFIDSNGYGNIVYCSPDSIRYYPNGALASTVLGFINSDGEGAAGIESYYNSTLTGVPGRIITAQNANQDAVESDYETYIDAKQGAGVVLTLDSTIQYYLEKAMVQGTADTYAKGAYGLVMDVNTGAILAMSSLPTYDPNSAYKIYDEATVAQIALIADEQERNTASTNALYAQWKNNNVTFAYEPGSIFKVITLAAALEEGVASESTSYTCTGSCRVAGNTIRCVNRSGHGTQTMTQGLMNSCNPFFITISQKMDTSTFYEYFKAFGFTESSGIDLPAEYKPKEGETIHYENNFTVSNQASSSFGQTFKCNAVQLLTAVSAVANGGTLMQPHIVKATVDADGNILSTTQPVAKRQVVSESTSKRVCAMMEQVVTSGTGKNAYIAGYHVAGKTATSQKLDQDDKTAYVVSFCCFAPADDPEIAILIVVDEPRGQYQNGSMVAAPIAREVMEQSLEYLNVEPEYTAKELASLKSTAPDLVGRTVSNAKQYAANKGFSTKVVGSGDKVISQIPSSNASIPVNGVIVLYTEENIDKNMVTVPDFSGMTVSQVNKNGVNAGLNVIFSGPTNSGEVVAYKQNIAAGQSVEAGSSITVYFHATNAGDD